MEFKKLGLQKERGKGNLQHESEQKLEDTVWTRWKEGYRMDVFQKRRKGQIA